MVKGAALYIRVSTQEQAKHGLSSINQREALQDYCRDHAIAIYGIYDDSGISGHASYKKRPALLKMISDCQAGKINLILFTRIDRYFRSIKDYYLVQDQIGDIPWRAIWEDYETETSAGQFKVNIMLSVSEAEAARTSEKVKSVIEYKRQRGDYIGSAPFGYLKRNNQLIIDEYNAKYVRIAFDTYLRTYSTVEAMRAMADAGHNRALLNVRRMLENETYCGNAPGGYKCPAYITKEQHDEIMLNVSKNRRYRKRTYDFIFTGLVVCGYCGCRMSSKGEIKQKGRKSYVCDGKRQNHHAKYSSIGENALEAQLLDKIEPLMASYNARGYQLAEKRSDAKLDVEKLKARLERVGVRFEVGDISVDEYKEKRAELLELINKAEREQTPFEPISLPESWRDVYEDLSVEGRRRFWRGIIDHVVVTQENRKSLSEDDIFLRT